MISGKEDRTFAATTISNVCDCRILVLASKLEYRDLKGKNRKDIKMTSKKHFTTKEARKIGESLGIDWSKFDVEQYRMGLDVELEHGLVDPHTNVTNDDPIMTGKIALAHLNEFPDYYTRLEKMEREAEGR